MSDIERDGGGRTEADLEIERIDALIDGGRWELAERRTRALLAAHPHEARALYELARCEINRDPIDHGDAARLLRDALVENPEFSGAQQLLVLVLVDQGHLDDADSLACDLLARDPEWSGAHLAYGSVCLMQDRFELAHSAAARSLELDPEAPEAWYLAVRIARRSEAPIAERRRLVTRWIEIEPHSANAHLELALLEQSVRDAAATARSVSTILAAEPTHPGAVQMARTVLRGPFRTAYVRCVVVAIVAVIMGGAQSALARVVIVIAVVVIALLVLHAMWTIRRAASSGVWRVATHTSYRRPSAWAAASAGGWLLGCALSGHTGGVVAFAVVAFIPVCIVVRLVVSAADRVQARRRSVYF